jgi:hypothetical protein
VKAEDLQKTFDEVMQSIVKKLISEIGENIESIFVSGSYATKTYSLQCPNANLYVVSKAEKSAKLLLPVSRIFHEIKRKYAKKINIAADLKPYRFAYFKPRKGEPTFTIRINLFDMKDKDKNFMVPNYVLRGWLSSEKVLYGTSVLKGLKIRVGKDLMTLNQKRFILLTIMQQLKHMPFTYNWTKEPELLFHESYEFSKYILSEGLLLKMNEKEIEKCLDVQIYENKEKFVDFYTQKYGHEVADLAKKILEAREHYLEWKDDENKAVEMYATAWQVWRVVWGTLIQMLPRK